MFRLAKRFPYLSQFVLSFVLSMLVFLIRLLHNLFISQNPEVYSVVPSGEEIVLLLIFFVIVALFCVYPLVLLGYQLILFGRALRWKSPQSHRPLYDTWVLSFLAVCTFLYLKIAKNVVFSADWREQLINSERHSPIAPGHSGWLVLLIFVCILAFYVLWVKRAVELPPLIPVLAVGTLYVTTGYVTLWTIQIYDPSEMMDLYLLVPAVTFYLLVARTITILVKSHTPDPLRAAKLRRSLLLARLNNQVARARNWPVLAFLMALPLLGLAYSILIVLGQGPHALIAAFTDTSEWTLSKQTSAPNLMIDDHYLCTVAAGGHRNLVKPLRAGVRHGNPVIVNRQLLVANAFEQVIGDRLPRTHRTIRHLYDRYGFELARQIRTKWAADLVWIGMKPMEWVFLTVIYLCVRHPEDLIAMQYTGVHYRQLADIEDKISRFSDETNMK